MYIQCDSHSSEINGLENKYSVYTTSNTSCNIDVSLRTMELTSEKLLSLFCQFHRSLVGDMFYVCRVAAYV